LQYMVTAKLVTHLGSKPGRPATVINGDANRRLQKLKKKGKRAIYDYVKSA